MSILQQFMETLEYRLNEAWEHQWTSYTNGQAIGFYNDYAAFKLIFNRETQEVIEISVATEADARAQHAYRWLNPDYVEAIKAEAESRAIPFKQALEDLEYVDLDVVEDILEKGKALINDEEFDKRVLMPLDLDEDLLMELFRKAHEKDITFNALMEEILKAAIDDVKYPL